MFPDDGYTKAELLLYYQTVAPLLLPHLRGRPLTLKAFPNGVKERPYYRRRLASTAPRWLSRVELGDGAAHKKLQSLGVEQDDLRIRELEHSIAICEKRD